MKNTLSIFLDVLLSFRISQIDLCIIEIRIIIMGINKICFENDRMTPIL